MKPKWTYRDEGSEIVIEHPSGVDILVIDGTGKTEEEMAKEICDKMNGIT